MFWFILIVLTGFAIGIGIARLVTNYYDKKIEKVKRLHHIITELRLECLADLNDIKKQLTFSKDREDYKQLISLKENLESSERGFYNLLALFENMMGYRTDTGPGRQAIRYEEEKLSKLGTSIKRLEKDLL